VANALVAIESNRFHNRPFLADCNRGLANDG
jgi:hypothetical protein